MPAWKFTKKIFHISFHVFCLHFLRMHHDYFFPRMLLFFRRDFESVRAQFLLVESSITCNLPVQSRFIWVNYLHVEYSIWRSLERSFCQINYNCLFLAIQSFLLCFDMYFFIKTYLFSTMEMIIISYFDICIKFAL